jgi:hypothetical protein
MTGEVAPEVPRVGIVSWTAATNVSIANLRGCAAGGVEQAPWIFLRILISENFYTGNRGISWRNIAVQVETEASQREKEVTGV